MTAKSDFNFKTGLEQTILVDSTSDSLQKLGQQAGKMMSLELAKGNTPGAMYLAKTSQNIAASANKISEYSNKRGLDNNTNNDASATTRPRAR